MAEETTSQTQSAPAAPEAGNTDAGSQTGPFDKRYASDAATTNADFQGSRPWEKEAAMDRASRREVLEKHYCAAEKEAAGESSLADAAVDDAAETLRELFGNKDLGAVAAQIARIEDGLAKNPAAMADQIARWALSRAPQFRAPKAEGKTAATFADTYRQAEARLETRQQLASLSKEHGAELGPKLVQAAGMLKMIIDDPMGGAARLAAAYGEPVTETHRQEVAQSKQEQQASAQIEQGLRRVIESGRLPGLENGNIQQAVADVLMNPNFQRTGDHGVDLEQAHRVVMEQARISGVDALKAKASKSISGGIPSAAVTAAKPPRNAREAIARQLSAMRH